MKKITLLLTAALLTSGLAACSDKSADTSTIVEAKELPTIDMVATHDIALEISTSQLTFVPNSVAPWLGRIILLDGEGHLYSTDIEGRAPKPVGNGKYIDIFGLAREAAPGVFLAITESNKIEAFIESDDFGNFSPMIYSGDEITTQTFCQENGSANNQVKLLTLGGQYKTLELTIESKSVAQNVSDTIVSPNQKSSCLSQFASIGQSPSKFNVVTGKTSGLQLYQVSPPELIFNANITNGLSVRGLGKVKFITTTTSNYGGGAYADGVLALVDANENRIVFISLSYAERQLLKAVNPLEETPQ